MKTTAWFPTRNSVCPRPGQQRSSGEGRGGGGASFYPYLIERRSTLELDGTRVQREAVVAPQKVKRRLHLSNNGEKTSVPAKRKTIHLPFEKIRGGRALHKGEKRKILPNQSEPLTIKRRRTKGRSALKKDLGPTPTLATVYGNRGK